VLVSGSAGEQRCPNFREDKSICCTETPYRDDVVIEIASVGDLQPLCGKRVDAGINGAFSKCDDESPRLEAFTSAFERGGKEIINGERKIISVWAPIFVGHGFSLFPRLRFTSLRVVVVGLSSETTPLLTPRLVPSQRERQRLCREAPTPGFDTWGSVPVALAQMLAHPRPDEQ
jgi:hypothetical protein